MRYTVQLFRNDGTLMVQAAFLRRTPGLWEAPLGMQIIDEEGCPDLTAFCIAENKEARDLVRAQYGQWPTREEA